LFRIKNRAKLCFFGAYFCLEHNSSSLVTTHQNKHKESIESLFIPELLFIQTTKNRDIWLRATKIEIQ
jgi:hypothetical protein